MTMNRGIYAFFTLTGVAATFLIRETKGLSLELLSHEDQSSFIAGPSEKPPRRRSNLPFARDLRSWNPACHLSFQKLVRATVHILFMYWVSSSLVAASLIVHCNLYLQHVYQKIRSLWVQESSTLSVPRVKWLFCCSLIDWSPFSWIPSTCPVLCYTNGADEAHPKEDTSFASTSAIVIL